MCNRKRNVQRIVLGNVMVAVLCFASPHASAKSCEVDSPCLRSGTCQSDGSCTGTPVAEGTSCNDENPCTNNDRCQQGECFGDNVANGTSCTDLFGSCTNNDRCRFGFCLGDFVCPDDGDLCTFDCDVLHGKCGAVPIDCNDECSTGSCNPETGECVNLVAKPDGTTCDDFNECTTGDKCISGECGGGGAVESPSPTDGPTTPTPTPTIGTGPTPLPCVGDCNEDGRITVDELVKAVAIALGNTTVGDCPGFDVNSDGRVTVDELIKGVNAALNGCLSKRPTPTPGPHDTPTVPRKTVSPTATAESGAATVARRAAGALEVTSRGLVSISDVFTLLLRQLGSLSLSGLSASDRGSAAIAQDFPCPAGGSINVDCTQDIIPAFPPRAGVPTYALTANGCTASGSAGTTVRLDGTLTAIGTQEGDVCFVDVPDDFTINIPNLTATATGSSGSVVVTLAGMSGSLSLTGEVSCGRTTATANLTGTMVVETRTLDDTVLSHTEATFNGTSITTIVDQYGNGCAPARYHTTMNGGATFTTNGNVFAATYDSYQVANDSTGGSDQLTVSGTITSDCFGAPVRFTTETPLAVVTGKGCPTAGVVLAGHGSDTDSIHFTTEQGVEIDQGNTGQTDDTFPSCTSPQLFVCPAQ